MSAPKAWDPNGPYLRKVDDILNEYPAVRQFEESTKVPKVYAVGGVVAFYVLLVFFNIGASFLVNTVGFIIPGYYSLKAVYSKDTTDDLQWLTYWICFAFFSIVENLFNPAGWFGLYYILKLVFVLWIALPQSNGRTIVFDTIIRPTFGHYFVQSSSAPSLSQKTK